MKNIIKPAIVLALASVLFFGTVGVTFADHDTNYGVSSSSFENNGPAVNLDAIWETR